jgi:hypothetical protein
MNKRAYLKQLAVDCAVEDLSLSLDYSATVTESGDKLLVDDIRIEDCFVATSDFSELIKLDITSVHSSAAVSFRRQLLAFIEQHAISDKVLARANWIELEEEG